MDIGVLGAVSITINGQTRGVRAGKPRTILATLALEAGSAVSYSDLAEELWDGNPPGGSIRNALQAHAARLRKVVDQDESRSGGTVLRAVNNGYLLDIPRGSVDSNRFLALANQGSAAVSSCPGRAVEQLQDALRLWRGPALFDAGEGLRCRSAAALLDERRLATQGDLIAARLATGDERRAVAELRQLVAQHPTRERFCDQLMLALYRCGRQGDALELFRQTRQRLDEELGLEPGVQLQRRHVEILSHDPALMSPSAVLDIPRTAAAPG